MEQVEDDFGELYADVGVEQDEEEVKKHTSDSNSNETQLVISSTLLLEALQAPKVVVEEEEEEEEESISSEDDLHIVLNDDEDCTTTTRLKTASNFEDDEDQHAHHDLKPHPPPLPLLTDGLDTTSERLIAPKSSYYSQYKYIRPHGEAFPFNGFGSAVSFPSSVRCDGDANGFSQQPLVPTSGALASLLPAQTRSDFSLPSHRTILDVSINAFEHKQWKQPGVDITDFFNFGLDEDTWKDYCNSLELLRQQSANTTKTYQAYGTGFKRQTVTLESGGRESAQICQSGGVSPMLNHAIKGERRLNIPKGRAIQVDGGIGERMPSMDTRRVQNRDSDVVIQVSIQDNREHSSNSSKEDLVHSDNSKLNISENGDSGTNFSHNASSAESTDEYKRQLHETNRKDLSLWSLKRCSQRKDDSIELLVGRERTVEEMEEIKDSKEDIQRYSVKEDPCSLESESSLDDRILCASSLSISDSPIKAPTIHFDSAKENKPARRHLSNSFSGLHTPVSFEGNHSKDFESNGRKTELGNNKDDSGSRNHVRGELDSCGRLRLRSVAETRNQVGDNGATPVFTETARHGEHHLGKSFHKRRERQFESDYYDREDLSYYRETEISFGYHRGKLADKRARDGCSENFYGAGRTKFRTETDLCFRKQWDEREYLFEKGFPFGENEARHREHFRPEREYSSRGLNGITQYEFTGLAPENSSYTEKERYRWQRRKIIDEQCFRRGTKDDDFVPEHRYREHYIQEKYARPVSNYDREWEYLNENYDKHASYTNLDRRDRYGGSPCMDILTDSSRDIVHDDECWQRPIHEDECWQGPAHESLSPHRELHLSYESGWRGAASLRNSRRSVGFDMDLWRETRREKHQSRDWFDRSHRDRDDADSSVYPDDHFPNEGRSYISQRRGCISQSKVLDWCEDIRSSKKGNQGRVYDEEASFCYERSSRHKAIHIEKYDSANCEMVVDENWLLHDRNRSRREETRDSLVNSGITSNFDLDDEDKNYQVAPRQRKSVDLHFVGWKGKASKRCFKAGDARSNGMEGAVASIVKESKIDKASEYSVLPSSHKNIQLCNSFLLEDGQLPIDDVKKVVNPAEANWYSDKVPNSGDIGVKEQPIFDPVNENKVAGGYDNRHILETLAKMERRRERFKEPIAVAVKETDKNLTQEPDTVVEPTESKQHRPARKRRWGGS